MCGDVGSHAAQRVIRVGGFITGRVTDEHLMTNRVVAEPRLAILRIHDPHAAIQAIIEVIGRRVILSILHRHKIACFVVVLLDRIARFVRDSDRAVQGIKGIRTDFRPRPHRSQVPDVIVRVYGRADFALFDFPWSQQLVVVRRLRGSPEAVRIDDAQLAALDDIVPRRHQCAPRGVVGYRLLDQPSQAVVFVLHTLARSTDHRDDIARIIVAARFHRELRVVGRSHLSLDGHHAVEPIIREVDGVEFAARRVIVIDVPQRIVEVAADHFVVVSRSGLAGSTRLPGMLVQLH